VPKDNEWCQSEMNEMSTLQRPYFQLGYLLHGSRSIGLLEKNFKKNRVTNVLTKLDERFLALN